MVRNWQDLVKQGLLLPTYDVEQDIKDALRYRFGSGKVVRERRIVKWFNYLIWLDDLKQRDKLLSMWSDLWQLKKGVSVQSIQYSESLGVIEQRIAGLRKQLNLPF